jgi:hypothetical protein
VSRWLLQVANYLFGFSIIHSFVHSFFHSCILLTSADMAGISLTSGDAVQALLFTLLNDLRGRSWVLKQPHLFTITTGNATT